MRRRCFSSSSSKFLIPSRLSNNSKHGDSSSSVIMTTIDCHCGGLPARILVDGVPEIEGNSAMMKRETMMRDYDW